MLSAQLIAWLRNWVVTRSPDNVSNLDTRQQLDDNVLMAFIGLRCQVREEIVGEVIATITHSHRCDKQDRRKESRSYGSRHVRKTKTGKTADCGVYR